MTLRTVVTDMPRATKVSATQPPTLAVTAMVTQGSTLKKPDAMMSQPRTCPGNSPARAPSGASPSSGALGPCRMQ
jgi:hypothetical protein